MSRITTRSLVMVLVAVKHPGIPITYLSKCICVRSLTLLYVYRYVEVRSKTRILLGYFT